VSGVRIKDKGFKPTTQTAGKDSRGQGVRRETEGNRKEKIGKRKEKRGIRKENRGKRDQRSEVWVQKVRR